MNKVIYILQAIKLDGIVRTIHYALKRDIINKRFSKRASKIEPVTPGKLLVIAPITGGVKIEYEHAGLELIFLSQTLVRVSWSPGSPPPPYSIAKTDWEFPQPIIQAATKACTLAGENLAITADEVGVLSFQDHHQGIVHKDGPPVRSGESWHLTSYLRPDDHIYGLGERASSFNLRPGSYTSWNTDVKGSYSTGTDPLYIGTPIYLCLASSGSHLVYFENTFKSSYTLGENLDAFFSGGMLRYYIIFGSINSLYEQLSELIGRPCFPPHWVFGYHQCRWGYRSESEIRDVVKGFEEHNLPLSAIHLDIDYMDGYRVFTNDPDRFTNLNQLTDDLNNKGIKVVSTINPAVKQDPDYKVYSDGLSKNVFCKIPDGKLFSGVSWPGWSVFPDFTNPLTREWWGEQYKFFVESGISGMWHDMNEPSSFAAWGDVTFPDCVQHDLDGEKCDHRQAHNIYGLLMNQAGYEGLRKYAPQKRPWIISRAGWAGLQRYAWNWTGDVETSWRSLKQTVPTVLGLVLSGHAFSGVDIGGFSGNPDAELYLRWFQMATFFPFCRTHSSIGTNPREPWVFGEHITNIIRNFLNLRYRLLPYIYTLAWDAAQTGIPPVRPLFWSNPENPALWDIEDEFLLGEELLIAPVMSQGAQKRQIILPPGEWYSYWNDQMFTGPIQFEQELSLENIPIYIKGGALLPMEENGILTLHCYPTTISPSSDHIYNDAGDGYGPRRLDKFHSNFSHNSVVVTWEKEGDYAFPYSAIYFTLHGKKLIQASADGVDISIQENKFISPIFNNLSLRFD